MTQSVVIVGATGRMGQVAARLVEAASQFDLTLCVGRQDDLIECISAHRNALALDFTQAGLGFEHGMAILEAGLRPVIGTSGVTPEEVVKLDSFARSRELGGIVVPNFSLGMACLQSAAQQIWKRHFDRAEIIETHHPAKLDAPSATSLETARLIEASRALSKAGGVPIQSLRQADVQARQELVFDAPGEKLALTHEVTSREAYGPGILMALEFASKGVGVAHGLASALAK